MSPLPQEFLKEPEHDEPLDDDLYRPMSDDEFMEETEDMDTRSVGLVLKELGRGQKEIVEKCEREILLAIESLGGSRKAYKRERKATFKRIVSEVYSPPRVAAAAKLLPSIRIIPGASLDITVNQENGEPWDFDLKENLEKARLLFEEQQPAILVGSAVYGVQPDTSHQCESP